MAQTKRRKLDRRELRLILFADSLDETQSSNANILHVARQTVKGEKIFSCHLAQKHMLDDRNYWDFPFLDFFLQSHMLCHFCEKKLKEEGLL